MLHFCPGTSAAVVSNCKSEDISTVGKLGELHHVGPTVFFLLPTQLPHFEIFGHRFRNGSCEWIRKMFGEDGMGEEFSKGFLERTEHSVEPRATGAELLFIPEALCETRLRRYQDRHPRNGQDFRRVYKRIVVSKSLLERNSVVSKSRLTFKMPFQERPSQEEARVTAVSS
ncbi:hypothetical protein B0H65DRAFT_474337 [Neurospora tetraspora]|uniref:Uncharacterized protein n=1 Tax=Neurospora tetraspora TaxID=94610 RepID=A0AAE0JBT5_9PEZI|nr:hypothetical protein B0H65DRAFT_474337 [Neurospora tetraspora]